MICGLEGWGEDCVPGRGMDKGEVWEELLILLRGEWVDGFRDTAGRVVDWIDRPRIVWEETGGRSRGKRRRKEGTRVANIAYI
jgi:hypothetical protein